MSRKALYISYNGALEQIVPSQVVPYLGELSKKGYEFSLLTFEKRDRIRQAGRQGMAGIRNRLKAKGIEWLWLPYHKRMPLAAALLDITIGAAYASYLVLFKKVKVVHARSIVPAVMCMIPKILGAKFIFDTRGLLAEEYVGGGHWKKGSLSYRLVKFFEAVALKMADSVVVLTNKHHQYLLDMRIFENRMAGSYIEVIPCCVDTDRFRPKGAKFIQHDSAGLRGDFIFTYLGKIGKHYMLDEMLDFLKIGFEVLPESKFMALTQDKPGQIISAAKRRMLDTGRIIVKKPSYEQIPELIRMSQAGIFFINPYMKFGSSPIKLGEFLSCGVPVIINKGIGDTEDLVVSNRAGVVIEGFDPASYAGALKELLKLIREDRGLSGRCAKAAVDNLSLGLGADRYNLIYERMFSCTW